MIKPNPKLRSASRSRLLGGATGLLTLLTVALIVLPVGASAALGDTDLSLTKSDSPDPVVKGGTLTYVITVQNLGAGATDDADNVIVTDTLPSQVDFSSMSTTAGTCQRAGTTITCNLGTLLASTAATVTIVGKTDATGTASNTATVSTTQIDTNAANNQDTETTVINAAPSNAKPKKGKKGKASGGCKSPTIAGTLGNDVLAGTAGNDVIVSYAGNDRIFAGGGNDVICAGNGRNRVVAGAGNDAIFGSGGRDRIRGKGGSDVINGGGAFDRCRGGPGRDTMVLCP